MVTLGGHFYTRGFRMTGQRCERRPVDDGRIEADKDAALYLSRRQNRMKNCTRQWDIGMDLCRSAWVSTGVTGVGQGIGQSDPLFIG